MGRAKWHNAGGYTLKGSWKSLGTRQPETPPDSHTTVLAHPTTGQPFPMVMSDRISTTAGHVRLDQP
ncbi:hypothetical protein PCANC_13981 [Puccinia coronata f. sp. avenae]|uniref:Uncharacterized protein n=1 Tax=Puccinia coronata f. sp. avenae TaxID=200324 RepID=A0A2N5SL17_9BASI|nr:hypothetical protein PCANC_13981 [Puccinia coronata f. sp. avenae]